MRISKPIIYALFGSLIFLYSCSKKAEDLRSFNFRVTDARIIQSLLIGKSDNEPGRKVSSSVTNKIVEVRIEGLASQAGEFKIGKVFLSRMLAPGEKLKPEKIPATGFWVRCREGGRMVYVFPTGIEMSFFVPGYIIDAEQLSEATFQIKKPGPMYIKAYFIVPVEFDQLNVFYAPLKEADQVPSNVTTISEGL